MIRRMRTVRWPASGESPGIVKSTISGARVEKAAAAITNTTVDATVTVPR